MRRLMSFAILLSFALTPHAAFKKPDANGKSINVLELHVLADKVDHAVNGTVVGSSLMAGLTADSSWAAAGTAS